MRLKWTVRLDVHEKNIVMYNFNTNDYFVIFTLDLQSWKFLLFQSPNTQNIPVNPRKLNQ